MGTVENISPTYTINIDSYLKDKKAESQLATVTKEIDAMEDEDVVFKKSQVNDKVKNLYFESVSNALLKEEPHDVNGRTVPYLEAVALDKININPHLMNIKAESIIAEVNREIEAMESEKAAYKIKNTETVADNEIQSLEKNLKRRKRKINEFKSKVTDLFANVDKIAESSSNLLNDHLVSKVDKLAESSSGLLNDHLLSMNKALDGAKDYFKNIVPPIGKVTSSSNRNSSPPG